MRLPLLVRTAALALGMMFVVTAVPATHALEHSASPPFLFDPPAEGNGFSFAPTPFEQVDTISGSLSLGFTDLSLPGNAGSSLSFVRTYNSSQGRWRLGIAGVPLHFTFASGSDLADIDFITADGGTHNAAGSGAQTITEEAWRFTKSSYLLEMPNGLSLTYGHVLSGVGGYLTQIADVYGNTVALSWASSTDHLQSVTQNLGQSHSRQVTFSNWTNDMADSMTCDSRTWTYSWATVSASPDPVQIIYSATPPLGNAWSFSYESGGGKKLTGITTPLGATIAYTWDTETFSTDPTSRVVVQTRDTGGAVPSGQWAFDWQNSGTQLVITTPVNKLTFTQTTVSGQQMAGSRLVSTLSNAVMETEALTYATIPTPLGTTPVVATRTLTRDTSGNAAAVFTTAYTYGSSDYADFGQPTQIDESGPGPLYRTTTMTYRHNFTPYLRGRLASTTTTVGSESVTSSFTYTTATGFLESQSTAGVSTSFTSDGRGNVATVTDANNHTTSATYDWGVVATSTPPVGAAASVSANNDGSVASVTVDGTTAQFAYDALGRVTSATPPVGAATTTSYSGTTITTTRGSTVAVTTVDGFGRAVASSVDPGFSNGTINAQTTYDAAGRVTYQSYPYASTSAGDTYTYDALGRMIRVVHSDTTEASISYHYWGRRLTDENNKATDQAMVAFGSPGTARLDGVTDANGAYWRYYYNIFGSLTKVDASVGPDRIWTYNSAGRLASDQQPESGTQYFTNYDAVGNVGKRTDAKSTEFTYTYDAGNRLTAVAGIGAENVSLTYDARGNVTGVSVANSSSTFAYDAANRLTSRTDAIVRANNSPYTFVTTFGYDTNDNLTLITYPSGREVRYDYDNANRVRAVRERPSANASDRTLAQSVTYAATGGMSAATYGNGTWETTTFSARGQPLHLQSLRPNGGSSQTFVDLTYGYTYAGDVASLNNAVANTSSSFAYDDIRRLTGVTGSGAINFTYDAAGNRTSKVYGGSVGTATYTYDSNTMRLSSISAPDATTYAYDSAGTLTREGAWWYSNTASNQIATVKFGADNTGPVVASYAYDGTGQRVEKTDAAGRHLYIQGPGGLLAEYLVRTAAGPEALEREYIYLGGRLLASINRADPTLLSVTMTNPTNNQTLSGGSSGVNVSLQATVSAPAGLTVQKVEYYQGGFKVGESTTAPYTVNWNNLPYASGTFRFIARVVTTDGHAAASSAVLLTITAHEPEQPDGSPGFPETTLRQSLVPSSLQLLTPSGLGASPALRRFR